MCLDIADVISFNDYPAWCVCQDKTTSQVLGMMNPETCRDQSKLGKRKPIGFKHIIQPRSVQEVTGWAVDVVQIWTISETGAGGVYEWQNQTDPYWSQNFQGEVVQQDIEFALESDRVSGITIWQAQDYACVSSLM